LLPALKRGTYVVTGQVSPGALKSKPGCSGELSLVVGFVGFLTKDASCKIEITALHGTMPSLQCLS
jgi:hypothetical protein